mgnify:CR=1 FL=1
MVYDVPPEAMQEIDSYEGKRYQRETVKVNTSKGAVNAQAYLVSHEEMTRHFGDRFHVNLIHELWLRKRIEKFIRKHIRPGERSSDAEHERQADRELLATTERDLVISHYRHDAVSDFYLEHELDRPRPSMKHLYNDKNAVKFIRNYLELVIKQVILNQLDAMIIERHRYDLDHMRTSQRYYNRSVSLLIALELMNTNQTSVELIIKQCLDSMPYKKNDLIDYVKHAVKAAKSMFHSRVVEEHLNRIASSMQPGLIPLGAEIELSNLGFAAVEPQRTKLDRFDSQYDDFRYFKDFCLDVLTWKLGGYIDDHTGEDAAYRKMGFLELAPGRLNIEGEISRPVSADPWLVNQLINAIMNFYDVQPHSLHLSFQLRRDQVGHQKMLPLGFVKCLFVLGGGLERRKDGRLWVSRMGYDELTQHTVGEELVFTRTSRRKWHMGDESLRRTPGIATKYVQQYKFIRLEKNMSYEPLIMALKGLQLGYNPADYLTAGQLKNKKFRNQYRRLRQWANNPTEIKTQTVNRFIRIVREGLMNEAHYRPVHELHYIDWAVGTIDTQLQVFNKLISEG